MDIRVHKFMNMYVHVCTMFKHVYTVLPYPVQGGRIPDVSDCFNIEDSSISALKTYTNIEAFKLCFDIEGASISILAGRLLVQGCSNCRMQFSSSYVGTQF